MLILVANLGSTSFKYKLYDMAGGERAVASGSADRIGDSPSAWKVTAGDEEASGEAALADHGAAIDLHLGKLAEMGVAEAGDIEAVGFKAVHGGPIRGAVKVDDSVIETMEQFADVAPAHNPPYIAAMRALAGRLPNATQVAAFETAFHQSIPLSRQAYAVPYAWIEDLGIRRYGFHGASHRYIATRIAELSPNAKRVINCHLGGSSSVCAIEEGASVATSMGLTPQTGLPQSSRVGDIDIFALLKLEAAGIEPSDALHGLGKEAGLAGLSGVGGDLRDIRAAAAEGNERAQLAVDVLVESLRHYIAAYLGVLNGADAIVFTGGIGQHQPAVRAAALARFDYAGIKLDEAANESATGGDEQRIDAADSAAQVWVLPTNEELIVARQTAEVVRNS
jgi:acetate kinase